MHSKTSRRRFVKAVACASAISGIQGASAQQAGGIQGFDHVAVPMQNTDAMLAFYRGLGLQLNETANAVSVYVGNQMINFHRPSRWKDLSAQRAPRTQTREAGQQQRPNT